MTPCLPKRSHRLAASVLGCVLALPLAAAPRDESAMTAAGLGLVSIAADGRLDDAFAAAVALASPRDPALPAIVDASRSRIVAETAVLGAPKPPAQLLPVDVTIFPGTIVRDYRLRYAGGEQRWRLKFRLLSSGWALADLNVRSERSN